MYAVPYTSLSLPAVLASLSQRESSGNRRNAGAQNRSAAVVVSYLNDLKALPSVQAGGS